MPKVSQVYFPFTDYAKRIKEEISLLELFELPEPIIWKINWRELMIIESKNFKTWKKVEFFNKISDSKKNPALYVFNIKSNNSQLIFEEFAKCKALSSQIKIEKGLKDKEFINFCHVPVEFRKSKCLYAGSVKCNLDLRLKQHLGYINSGRTGALYLKQALQNFDVPPLIEIKAYVLEKKYVNLTEHLESVVQDTLKPILGKRALKKITEGL
jgi:hypothetical protein